MTHTLNLWTRVCLNTGDPVRGGLPPFKTAPERVSNLTATSPWVGPNRVRSYSPRTEYGEKEAPALRWLMFNGKPFNPKEKNGWLWAAGVPRALLLLLLCPSWGRGPILLLWTSKSDSFNDTHGFVSKGPLWPMGVFLLVSRCLSMSLEISQKARQTHLPPFQSHGLRQP